MKKNFILKATAAVSAACVLAAGASLPAQADPDSVGTYATLAGFGSDTTMDVMDAVAREVNEADGSELLASYKATGGKDVYSKQGTRVTPRANGSSAGRDILLVALGQQNSKVLPVASSELGIARTTPITTQSVAGLVQWARSSSSPSGAEVKSDGVITYVPFATDSMTYATSPNSKIPSGIKYGSAGNTSEVSLINIYKGNVDSVVLDANGDYVSIVKASAYTPADGETLHTINAYIPQAGSGTRAYWISRMGITETQIANGLTAAKDKTANNLSCQEHDGSCLVGDPFALAGFSISQWVAQTNGVSINRLAGAVLNELDDSVSPTTGSGTSFATNPSWSTSLKRTVYNIVPTAEVEDTTSDTYRAFVGIDSLVCKATSSITRLGFGLLATPADENLAAARLGTLTGSGATTCGSIVASNRMYSPSPSTIALGTPAITGNVVKVTATVTSNGDQGGTVNLYNTSEFADPNATPIATGVVAAGATTVELTYTNIGATAVTKDVTAEFIPTLSGVAPSNTTGSFIAKGVAKVSAKLTYTSGSVSKRRGTTQKVTVTVKYGTETDATNAVGTVTVKIGSKTYGTATLVNGVATVSIGKFTSKGTRSISIIYTDTSNGNATTNGSTSFKIS